MSLLQANQNGVKYLRSGNPGYLVDLPVITAINQSNSYPCTVEQYFEILSVWCVGWNLVCETRSSNRLNVKTLALLLDSESRLTSGRVSRYNTYQMCGTVVP